MIAVIINIIFSFIRYGLIAAKTAAITWRSFLDISLPSSFFRDKNSVRIADDAMTIRRIDKVI